MGQTATMPAPPGPRAAAPTYWGLTGYQWLVVAAAWLGWGFDVFDGLLFNYVAPACVPDLLGITKDTPGYQGQISFWTGTLTSVLLIGWGVGGILFGKIADRIGRTRALLVTMLLYSLATAGCAFANNIWMLMFFRVIASLGIGGEWAAGASLVAETVPENKRVWAGMLLYTASPFGILLATLVSDVFLHQIDFAAVSESLGFGDASWGWRAVFLTGLVPALVALVIRIKVKEPEMWKPDESAGRVSELFSPAMRSRTIGGLAMTIIALLGWWSCFAFIPLIGNRLGTAPADKSQLVFIGTAAYSLGGLIGTILTMPIALTLGRRWMFALYFAFSAAAIWLGFGGDWEAKTRMWMMLPVGIGVFGVFGAFTFYLPELFPTRLRGTGAGFCYNTGRFIAAGGPFLIGALTTRKFDTPGEQLEFLLTCVSWVAVFPALGVVLVLCRVCHETKGQALTDHG
ncbi:MAG TPA: MFS transporter [Phycisphaerales bacterium]|nr:MFS transporter [Phycisphaerales bacterium]